MVLKRRSKCIKKVEVRWRSGVINRRFGHCFWPKPWILKTSHPTRKRKYHFCIQLLLIKSIFRGSRRIRNRACGPYEPNQNSQASPWKIHSGKCQYPLSKTMIWTIELIKRAPRGTREDSGVEEIRHVLHLLRKLKGRKPGIGRAAAAQRSNWAPSIKWTTPRC